MKKPIILVTGKWNKTSKWSYQPVEKWNLLHLLVNKWTKLHYICAPYTTVKKQLQLKKELYLKSASKQRKKKKGVAFAFTRRDLGPVYLNRPGDYLPPKSSAAQAQRIFSWDWWRKHQFSRAAAYSFKTALFDRVIIWWEALEGVGNKQK